MIDPKKHIDIVGIVISIYNTFQSPIPSILYNNSKLWERRKKENPELKLPSMREVIDSVRDRVMNINKEYNLSIPLKSELCSVMHMTTEYDETVMVGKDGEKGEEEWEEMIVYIEPDDENLNKICFVRVDEDGIPEKDVKGKANIVQFLVDIENLIFYVVKCARFVGENYKANYNNIGIKKAIARTLEAFGIKGEMQEKLSFFDEMVYSDFRYYQLVNDESHDTMTKVYLVFWDFSDLPF
ncbi:MAG: hypothetical protein IT273_14715 [Chitinophagales bacterium]|nr:hypothetical protein [Chitinophagales bacterium]